MASNSCASASTHARAVFLNFPIPRRKNGKRHCRLTFARVRPSVLTRLKTLVVKAVWSIDSLLLWNAPVNRPKVSCQLVVTRSEWQSGRNRPSFWYFVWSRPVELLSSFRSTRREDIWQKDPIDIFFIQLCESSLTIEPKRFAEWTERDSIIRLLPNLKGKTRANCRQSSCLTTVKVSIWISIPYRGSIIVSLSAACSSREFRRKSVKASITTTVIVDLYSYLQYSKLNCPLNESIGEN